MAPRNIKVPGLSHADSEVIAGAIDSPRVFRNGRQVPPTPRASEPAGSASGTKAESSAASLSGRPPTPQASEPAGSASGTKAESSAASLSGRPPTPQASEPAGSASGIKAESSAASPSGQPPPSMPSDAAAGQPPPSMPSDAAAGQPPPSMPSDAAAAQPPPSMPSDAAAAQPPPNSRQGSFSRSRSVASVESSAARSVEKAQADATNTARGAASGSEEAGSSSSQAAQVNSHAVTSSSQEPVAQANSRAYREITPLGGFLSSEIDHHLRHPDEPFPRVLCMFCTQELAIGGAQPPGDGREPFAILPCDHVFGEDCINRYIGSFGRTVDIPCPMCRGLFYRLPSDAPPQVRRLSRSRSPTDIIMPDIENVLRADPHAFDGISEAVPVPQTGSQRPPGPSADISQAEPPPGPPEPSAVAPEPHRGRWPRGQKMIVIRDPEKRNGRGFVESPARLLGRLAMRGKMAVELPSENRQFPLCTRRYILQCKDYQIKWGSLHPLQKRDLGRLKRIAKSERELNEGHWAPEVVGIISSPQYVTEVQANFNILLLRLPDGDEWHSKSDAFAVFGDLTNEMEEYWYRSGQTLPWEPRKIHHREHLQHLGVQGGGVDALTELDNEVASVTARLLRQTKELDKRRLAAGRRPDPEADRVEPAAAERGRNRRPRSPTL